MTDLTQLPGWPQAERDLETAWRRFAVDRLHVIERYHVESAAILHRLVHPDCTDPACPAGEPAPATLSQAG